MRILVVEDEKRLADALTQIMREQKYTVDAVYDGEDGYQYALTGDYDAVVLDVMLPKRDGYEVVRALRREKIATPVLMLTARDELESKIAGLDCGADDYMTKPFAPEELTARIRALTRRQGEVLLEELSFEDTALELGTGDLRCGQKRVHLSFKEFEVMRLLMLSQNAIVPKEQLIVKVWGPESDAEDNNVEAYISFLRKKLFFIGSKITIQTVRKLGYRLGTEQDA
ncbi:MAG: response regulator transcription factor [Clostridiales bacterium]|nr:response regulator transcription factor [Clostridiales bacterium]